MFLDYKLPEHLVAQSPCEPRDESRLMVVHRDSGQIEHRQFLDLPDLLRSGDLVVLNDTKVLPARLVGKRTATGGKWEGLFLGRTPSGDWELLSQARGRLIVGEEIAIDPGPLRLTLLTRPDGEPWTFRPSEIGPPEELLARFGRTPLPPYIRKGVGNEADRVRYQTVFAKYAGSVAAPTAGLHFTERVFDRLKERGVETAFVTLHVGLGTFQPLQCHDPSKHIMHGEWCTLSAEAANRINSCRSRGGRVVAVGTTTVRTLESAARVNKPAEAHGLSPWKGETKLFICPPHEFRAVDVLVTNFHLPRTSLLLLVGAFAGEELLRRAYHEAIENRYRFFSYGDAMVIV